MKNAPGGVYIMPEFDNIRRLHGVIFVRKGLYRDGIFRFLMELPDTYNGHNAHPVITFTPPVFNPMVHPETGRLDLSLEDAHREWLPDKHFIVTALTYLKLIFYMKSFDKYASVPNEEARKLFDDDKDAYFARIRECVSLSVEFRLAVPQDENCPLIFSEPQPEHLQIVQKILYASEEDELRQQQQLQQQQRDVDKTELSIISIGISAGFVFNIPEHAISSHYSFLNGRDFVANAAEPFVGDPAPVRMGALADVGIKEFLVKDGRQFLRLSIPLAENGQFVQKKGASSKSPSQAVYRAQELLELVRLRFEQVGVTNPSIWGSAIADANAALAAVKENKAYLVQPSQQCVDLYDGALLPHLSALIDNLRSKDVTSTLRTQEIVANDLSSLRIAQLPPGRLPFEIPADYSNRPRLNGRATVEMKIHSSKGFRLSDGKSVASDATLTLELDGYTAPLTAGGFADLVAKKYYDNMPIQKVLELFVQTGKPDKGRLSLVSSEKIPLELFYKVDSEPTYGITSDDDLRSTDAPALPFQAFGALGMARDNESPDSADTQFFFLKWKQALIAPGRNTLDGFYSCFGYVTRNEDLLSQLEEGGGDYIVSAQVVRGLENLQR
eukprot:gene30313-39539_t